MPKCLCSPGSDENGWRETRCEDCLAVERKQWEHVFEIARSIAADIRAAGL